MSPIELYLGQLRAKLETRFDSECADQLLTEIRAHLTDSAAELEEEGVLREEAERLSVSRFGAPEKAAFLLPLGQQFGTGDRYWGRGAFWVSIIVALGLTWYALDPTGHRVLSKNELPPILALILAFYAYACWRAKSFSMVRQSSIAIALIIVVTGLFRVHIVDPTLVDTAANPSFRTHLVQREFSPLTIGSTDSMAPLIADLRTSSNRSAAADLSYSADRPASLPSDSDGTSAKESVIHGMAPIGQDPWSLTQQGLLPEVSQLLLSWLFLILMVNASVCWVGCLEHEQKGGLTLVQ